MNLHLSDDRRGVPSASGLERLILCPGSWRMQRGIPLDVGQGHRAVIGSRMHDVLAGLRPIEELSATQQQIVRSAHEHAERLLAELGLDGDGATRIIEERLWMHYRDGAPAFSARFDLAVVHGGTGLVLDYKTGSGSVTPPESNPQLQAQAVLLLRHHRLEQVYAAIVQPRADEAVSVARYDADSLRTIEADLFAALRAAMEEDAPLVPGHRQCRHCRARRSCPAVH